MPARLRPFSVGELLDGAFSLYRRNFISFFAIALIPQVPLILLWLALPFIASSGGEAVITSTTAVSLPYSSFVAVLIWAALVFGSMRGYEGTEVSASEALRVGLRKLVPSFVAYIVVLVLMFFVLIMLAIPAAVLASPAAIGAAIFFGVIFAIAIAPMFFAVIPAIVVENRGPFEALGRSRRLSKGARLRILGVFIIAFFIAMLPVMAFSVFAGVAAAAGMAGGGNPTLSFGWQAVVQAGSFVLSALTTPYSVAALTLLYVDRRARTEAPDLEEAAARLSQV